MAEHSRKEEHLQTEVERYRLRVESKLQSNSNPLLGLQKHIDNMKYSSTPLAQSNLSSSMRSLQSSSNDERGLRQENEKLKQYL